LSQSGRSAGWRRVSSAAHLQLSAVNPPDARVPGPVVGPGARVRPCDGALPESDFGVLCLEVDSDGRVTRGYTIRRMVSMTPEHTAVRPAVRRLLFAACAIVALLAAMLLVVD
jgi:hypothetical protein